MPDHEEQGNINALASLLNAKGLDASDFIDVINALSNIKKREVEKQEKEEAKEEEQGLKIFHDKEFVIPTQQDCFIYKHGKTKSGRYYVRIYDERTKRVFSQSLRTTNRIEALASAQKIYFENKHRMKKGVKLTSITTKELIGIYLRDRAKVISNKPHTGITQSSYDTLISNLKYWENYIEYKGHKKTKLEDIPPEIAKGFGVWVKELPKSYYKNEKYGERSNETINHYIAAVKKMYRDIAIEEKYITMQEFPIFKYLKVPKDNAPKRDILEKEEFTELRKWMENKWCREKDIDELERIKRRVYGLYLTIQYYAGFRNKEILGLRWKDVSTIKTESKELQRVNRAMHIPAENSKTGKSRQCVAAVAYQFERIKAHYKKLGIIPDRDDFIFINLAKTKRGKNIPYMQPAMEKRLKSVIEGSGLKKKLDETGRHITQYSARHYAITDALMRGVSIYDIAVNCGTSVFYIEKTYSKIISTMRSETLTQGQGYHQVLKEREEKRGAAENAIKDALTDNQLNQLNLRES